jgi:hypothetical protein
MFGIPQNMLFAMLALVIGGIGATYIGFRAKGWRSVLPFQGGDSTLRIYLRGMKEERWPKWPFYLWLVSIPVTLFFFFRFAVELARH